MAPYSYMIHRYTVTVGSVVRDDISRSMAAMYISIAREVGREFTVKHVSYLVETEREMCFGCGARPVLWEMDCDGPYESAECGQCDWWACVNFRDMQEARQLVRR